MVGRLDIGFVGRLFNIPKSFYPFSVKRGCSRATPFFIYYRKELTMTQELKFEKQKVLIDSLYKNNLINGDEWLSAIAALLTKYNIRTSLV